MTDKDQARIPGELAPAGVPPGMKLVESTELFGGDKTVMIRHEHELYRLAITRNGKLILQK